MYVKITATDQDLESFCYLPLKSGEVYAAKHSTLDDFEYNTFLIQLSFEIHRKHCPLQLEHIDL